MAGDLKRSVADDSININIISINGASGLTVNDAKQALIKKFGNRVKRSIENGGTVIVRTESGLPDYANKEKSRKWFKTRGLQLPKVLNQSDFKAKYNDYVNRLATLF